MCIADIYRAHEPLPGVVTFPPISGIHDVMAFRFEASPDRRLDKPSDPAIICSAGVWESVQSAWVINTYEREYCRVVQGVVRLADRYGRRWEFTAGSAFLLLRGFQGRLEVLDATQIVYVVFSLADGGALSWCMTGEGRTALGQQRENN